MHLADVSWVVAALLGVAGIVWGAEAFAENLASAATSLRVSAFALALLLAGAEPEELATGVAASLRHVPAVAFGDVIGANVAICLVALAVGAVVAPLAFGARVQRYGILAIPIGIASAALAWDGEVSRLSGLALIAMYGLYVLVIWRLEGAPPALGESGELAEAKERGPTERRIGKAGAMLFMGVAAMAIGATVLVEAVRRTVHAESSQTTLSLTIVGFATAFELVVLAWSAQRRGAPEAVVAAVVGSFAYNASMTLGAAAVVRPLRIVDAKQLHTPLALMIASLALVLVLGRIFGRLTRPIGLLLIAGYAAFVAAAVFRV